jgi:Tfp pilus assembly PilM family ATPase
MSLLSSLRDTSGPSVAVEIASNRVSAASLGWRGGEAVVASHASEPLPPGALVPAFTVANTHDRAAVVAALDRVLERVGRPRRIGLIVPDLVAKVSLVRFEQVPTKTAELDQLVRWQVRKTAPFAIEEAQISYVEGIRVGAEHEFVVSLARRDIIEEYEALATAAGAHAGIVDLSTFNAINAALAAPPPPTLAAGDWLLVNVAPEYASIAILRGPHLIFFRNRAADTDGTLADLVHQTAMYYEDRLSGAGFARVILTGAASAGHDHAGELDQMRLSLERRLSTPVETLDPRLAAALTDRIAAGPELLDVLAPLVGLLLRDRKSRDRESVA